MSDADRPTSSITPSSLKAPPGVLHGPIISTMLRLAGPTVVVLVVQTFVGVVETYFVSFLGTEALAGVTLVFPILMLMQMTSNGGIGGGVSSAVSRALGAGRRADAEALVWHAIVIAVFFGLTFTAAAIFAGPALYRAMGGQGATLTVALTYSSIVFAGSVPLWIVALLSSALRGAGEVKVPAMVSLTGAAVLIPLSPALIFGWGPFPRLGVAGGGTAVVIYYLVAALMLFLYLRSPRSPITLKITALNGRQFGDILGVGLLSAIGTLQVNLTVTVVTAVVGHFGAAAIAGYGIASRLEYVQIPLLFGLGTAIVTMVGINIGANQNDRARRIAWIGGAMAFCATEAIGLLAAIFPHAWLGLFSQEPEILSLGTLYLHTMAPVYGAVGLSMALYFASQGMKRVLWPVLAGTARMIVAAVIGWVMVVQFGADLRTLFLIVALAAVLSAVIVTVAILSGAWSRGSRARRMLQSDLARNE
ncbi:MAG: family efflux transporter [Rhodocyclales bacterium]|nr:family efflux transporter [Rhodocyclales bacterium]